MIQTIGKTRHDHSGGAFQHGTSSFLSAPCFLYILPSPTPCSHEPFRKRDSSDASCTVQEFPIQRQKPELRCQEQLSVFIKKDLRFMAQYTSHEPRNSVRKVLSQDSSEMRGRLYRTFPLVGPGFENNILLRAYQFVY